SEIEWRPCLMLPGSALAAVPGIGAASRGTGLAHDPREREADREDTRGEDDTLRGRKAGSDPEQEDASDEENDEHDEIDHVESFQGVRCLSSLARSAWPIGSSASVPLSH